MCAEFVLSKTSCKIYIALDIVNLPIILKNTQPKKYHMFAYFQQNLSATALDQEVKKALFCTCVRILIKQNGNILSFLLSFNNNTFAFIKQKCSHI